MGSTFLDLVNKVLHKTNQEPLTNTTFPTARGVHAQVKESVRDAIAEIQIKRTAWPFNAKTESVIIVPEVREYDLPADAHNVGWKSFYVADLGEGNTIGGFHPMGYQEWVTNKSWNNTPGKPSNVIRLPVAKFAVHPIPDKEYVINYTYWVKPQTLTLPTDTTTIPTEYDYIITERAISHMGQFYQDKEAVMMSNNAFEDMINDMTRNLETTEFQVSTTIRWR